MNRTRWLLVAFGLGLALWQWGQAGWIAGKAVAAQWLLERAWAESTEQHTEQRPWPWADFTPVSRLSVPALDITRIVLGNVSGRTLAFGPGRLPATAGPGEHGTVVLAGHRDTHFAFLRRLKPGMAVELTSTDGRIRRFRVVATRIMDSRTERVSLAHPGRLILSTCWPFDAVAAGGPMRFLVIAESAGTTPSANGGLEI